MKTASLTLINRFTEPSGTPSDGTYTGARTFLSAWLGAEKKPTGMSALRLQPQRRQAKSVSSARNAFAPLSWLWLVLLFGLANVCPLPAQTSFNGASYITVQGSPALCPANISIEGWFNIGSIDAKSSAASLVSHVTTKGDAGWDILITAARQL